LPEINGNDIVLSLIGMHFKLKVSLSVQRYNFKL